MSDLLELELPMRIANLQLPDPDLLEYYEDEARRVLWIEGEITDALFEMSKLILKYNREDKDIPVEERTPIKIFINSPGGVLDGTLAFIGLIGLSKTPVWTINAGWAYSAAGLILMAGHKRYALPNSQCLIHSGSGTLGGTFEAAESQMQNYKKLVKKMKEFILEKTSVDPKLFRKRESTEWYLSVEEMLKYSVVDEEIQNLDVIL